MFITLVEDDLCVLGVLTDLLRHMGHEVRAFSNPRDAIADLSTRIDLVISDIALPGIDGFGIASAVDAVLGNHLPRVLLITGGDYQAELATYPPSMVIGVMRKPIRYADLSRVVSLISETRTRCPGTVRSFCRHVCKSDDEHDRAAGSDSPCFTSEYANCKHYDSECGIALRGSVASHSIHASATQPKAYPQVY